MRELLESALYVAQRDTISPDVQRMDELLEALTWGLGEDAEQFFRVLPNRNLWLAKTDPFPGAPSLRVWYTFDDNIVTLLSIEKIQES